MDQPDPFEKRLMDMDPELFAEIDAEVAAEENDPNFKPEPVAWRDDPDPFGMDWKWLEDPDEETTIIPKSSQVKSESPSRQNRSPAFSLGLALVACLLIGFGMIFGHLAFNGGDGNVASGQFNTLLASATPRYGTVRGNQRLLLLDIESKRPGFATIISASLDQSEQIFPEPGEELFRVSTDEVATYGPLPADSATALVVITETPATSLIRDALLDEQFGASNFDDLNTFVVELLENSGYHWAAVSNTTFPEENSN